MYDVPKTGFALRSNRYAVWMKRSRCGVSMCPKLNFRTFHDNPCCRNRVLVETLLVAQSVMEFPHALWAGTFAPASKTAHRWPPHYNIGLHDSQLKASKMVPALYVSYLVFYMVFLYLVPATYPVHPIPLNVVICWRYSLQKFRHPLHTFSLQVIFTYPQSMFVSSSERVIWSNSIFSLISCDFPSDLRLTNFPFLKQHIASFDISLRQFDLFQIFINLSPENCFKTVNHSPSRSSKRQISNSSSPSQKYFLHFRITYIPFALL